MTSSETNTAEAARRQAAREAARQRVAGKEPTERVTGWDTASTAARAPRRPSQQG